MRTVTSRDHLGIDMLSYLTLPTEDSEYNKKGEIGRFHDPRENWKDPEIE